MEGREERGGHGRGSEGIRYPPAQTPAATGDRSPLIASQHFLPLLGVPTHRSNCGAGDRRHGWACRDWTPYEKLHNAISSLVLQHSP